MDDPDGLARASRHAARLRPKRLLLEPVATDRIDLAGPPPAKPGQLRTLVDIYRSAGYRYGIDWRVLAAINRVETNFGRTRTSRAPARSAGCSSCPRPGGAGASTPPATASPIPTTRRTRSSAPRATSTPPRATRHPPRGLRVQPRQLVRERSARDRGRDPGRLRRVERALGARGERVRPGKLDAGGVTGSGTRRPERVGVRVRGQHAPPALLTGTAADSLGPAEALAREFLEAGVAELRAVARPARARERTPLSAGSTARSERSSATRSARQDGQGRSAGRSTAGPLQWPHTGQP